MVADQWVVPALALVFGYLLGSVPFGLLVTRAAGRGDLRAIGSGNIGATNVLRTGHKGLAALTLLLDIGKGLGAVKIVGLLWPDLALLAGAAAFFGHLFPVWLRFRGGKGVATFLGVALGLSLLCGAIFAGAWLVVLALTRYSSLAGMTAAIVAPVVAAWSNRFDLALVFIVFALLVLWRHRGNLERLLAGTEPRVGDRRGDALVEASDV